MHFIAVVQGYNLCGHVYQDHATQKIYVVRFPSGTVHELDENFIKSVEIMHANSCNPGVINPHNVRSLSVFLPVSYTKTLLISDTATQNDCYMLISGEKTYNVFSSSFKEFKKNNVLVKPSKIQAYFQNVANDMKKTKDDKFKVIQKQIDNLDYAFVEISQKLELKHNIATSEITRLENECNAFKKLLCNIHSNETLPCELVEELSNDLKTFGFDPDTEALIKMLQNVYELYETKCVLTLGQYNSVKELLDKAQHMCEEGTWSEDEQENTLCNLLQAIEKLPNSDVEVLEKSSETLLNVTNIVEHAIQFYKQNNLSNQDLVETIQAMLESNTYTLGQELTQNKMDFTEANTLFLAGVAPAKLNKNDLQSLIFKNVVSEDFN
jgi:hypothetical protein